MAVVRTGVTDSAETFNPVFVDSYRIVGYPPDALVNHLPLLDGSLDDRTEFLAREEMTRHAGAGRRAPRRRDFKR